MFYQHYLGIKHIFSFYSTFSDYAYCDLYVLFAVLFFLIIKVLLQMAGKTMQMCACENKTCLYCADMRVTLWFKQIWGPRAVWAFVQTHVDTLIFTWKLKPRHVNTKSTWESSDKDRRLKWLLCGQWDVIKVVVRLFAALGQATSENPPIGPSCLHQPIGIVCGRTVTSGCL